MSPPFPSPPPTRENRVAFHERRGGYPPGGAAWHSPSRKISSCRTNEYCQKCTVRRVGASYKASGPDLPIASARYERVEQGPTEPHTGRGTFLMSSDDAGGGYHSVALDTGRAATEKQFHCHTLVAVLGPTRRGRTTRRTVLYSVVVWCHTAPCTRVNDVSGPKYRYFASTTCPQCPQ